jgi:hypothetical protein
MANKIQTLHCRAGHDWERESQRGKPPVWCAEHKPEKITPVRMDIKTTSGGAIVLTCKDCHNEWERERQRGRMPVRCPECKETHDQAAEEARQRAAEKRQELAQNKSSKGDDDSPVTPKPKNKKDIVVTEEVLKTTRKSYPDCKCENLGLKASMTWEELTKLGAGLLRFSYQPP